MTRLKSIKVLSLVAMGSASMLFASTAQAQSTEEAVGAVVGGVAGAVIGGELDKKGSKTEGRVIGGVVGAGLGYVIGGALEGDKDEELRRRYSDKPGQYYSQNGKPYRRYGDPDYGVVSFPIFENDPFYFPNGRKKSHPVFAEHPGRGKGKGLYKNKKQKKNR